MDYFKPPWLKRQWGFFYGYPSLHVKKNKSAIPSKPAKPALNRKPRLLWANVYCLLDTSSGASIQVREMLLKLVSHGWEVAIVSASIFDAEKGLLRLDEHREVLKQNTKKFIKINDGPLIHHVLVTASAQRAEMTSNEEGTWYAGYINALETFKPDIVWFYGGQTLDMLIPDEAKARGVSTAFYLANGNYLSGNRWRRDVDLIITDSQATASMYRDKMGFDSTPVGAFIDPSTVIVEHKSPQHVLLVNPSLAKGAAVVILLALALEQKRSDITFEVVQSRGNWEELVKLVTTALGKPRESLSNVIVTPNTTDMRPIYSRARLLLAPSLCWESFGRVAAEAMMNGIPAIVTNRGGLPEVIGDGGIKLEFPPECYEDPYSHIPKLEHLQPVADVIERFFDDEAFYQGYVQKAYKQGERYHISQSTERLLKAFAPLLQKRAGGRVCAG